MVHLEYERKKLNQTRTIGRDPQLDLEFEYTEDELLQKLGRKHYIRRDINDMYGKTLTKLAKKRIKDWKKELRELKEKLKMINLQYFELVSMRSIFLE